MNKKTKILAKITEVKGSTLCGELEFSASAPDITVELYIENQHIEDLTIDLSLPEGKASTNHAFEFAVSDLPEWLQSTIEIRVTRKEEGNIAADSICYCPRLESFIQQLENIFDAPWYLSKYLPGELSIEKAFEHYIDTGIYLDHDPCLWFSNSYFREQYSNHVGKRAIPVLIYLDREPQKKYDASEIFSPGAYVAANPDLANIHALLAHFVKHGHTEGRNYNLEQLQEELVSEVESLIELEPLLKPIASDQTRIVKYPFLKRSLFAPTIARNHFQDDIKAIVCTPFISVGGADLVSTYVLKALQEKYGQEKVILAVTDQSRIERPDWLEDNSKILDLVQICGPEADISTKVDALYHIVGQLDPEVIFNVNSHVTWELYRKFGKQLSSALDQYAYLFCFDHDHTDKRVGYIPSYLPSCIGYLTSVLFDNRKIVNEVIDLYGFSESDQSKLLTLYIPSKELKPAHSLHRTRKLDGTKKRKVLWAGRFARQKRVDVLINIARAMPDVVFEVFGTEGNAPEGSEIVNNKHPNIKYKGTFNSYEELRIHEYDAYLYTSQWDGIPSILINLMRLGIPICTPKVGGIPELVSQETGWLVEKFDDVQAYETTLRRIFSSHDIARQKSHRGVTYVKDKHQWEGFKDTIAKVVGAGTTSDHPPETIEPRIQVRN
ncbi:MAG: glycosyltransferase family 4 protein [Gammaproteobacteria bacterium]|nr:glycosyltransferase family 4 protein [Gammaproteobacteria bacterium]